MNVSCSTVAYRRAHVGLMLWEISWSEVCMSDGWINTDLGSFSAFPPFPMNIWISPDPPAECEFMESARETNWQIDKGSELLVSSVCKLIKQVVLGYNNSVSFFRFLICVHDKCFHLCKLFFPELPNETAFKSCHRQMCLFSSLSSGQVYVRSQLPGKCLRLCCSLSSEIPWHLPGNGDVFWALLFAAVSQRTVFMIAL